MKARADAILRPEQAAYLDALEPLRDALLAEMERYALEHGHQPISDPEVASFLRVTACARAPQLVVELGTNIGYGGIVLARAAGPQGRVVTIEKDPSLCDVAKGFIARAGLAERIEVRCGDALTELGALQGSIDFVYIDCVKEDYPAYLDALLPRLAPRGVIVADNVLWKGHVAADPSATPAGERARVTALREFNRRIVSEPALSGVVLPLGDGVAYAIRVS